MPSNTRKNRYVFRSRIAEAKFRQLVHLFTMDIEATKIAKLSGLSRQSVNKYLLALRIRIAKACFDEGRMHGETETDANYVKPQSVSDRPKRGAGKNTMVVGIRKHSDRVYTEVVPDSSKKQVLRVIHGHEDEANIMHSGGWHGYKGLIDMRHKKYYRVRHASGKSAVETRHINSVESFWGYTKMRLARMRGVHTKHFMLHLKECEFRFNHRKENLYQIMLKLLRKEPIKLS